MRQIEAVWSNSSWILSVLFRAISLRQTDDTYMVIVLHCCQTFALRRLADPFLTIEGISTIQIWVGEARRHDKAIRFCCVWCEYHTQHSRTDLLLECTTKSIMVCRIGMSSG